MGYLDIPFCIICPIIFKKDYYDDTLYEFDEGRRNENDSLKENHNENKRNEYKHLYF